VAAERGQPIAHIARRCGEDVCCSVERRESRAILAFTRIFLKVTCAPVHASLGELHSTLERIFGRTRGMRRLIHIQSFAFFIAKRSFEISSITRLDITCAQPPASTSAQLQTNVQRHDCMCWHMQLCMQRNASTQQMKQSDTTILRHLELPL
jgi:hypothetical protein